MSIEHGIIAIMGILLVHAWLRVLFYKRVCRGFKVLIEANHPGVKILDHPRDSKLGA